MSENSKTQAWKLYEKGLEYNNRLTPNQYSMVETNTAFFNGNQWLHLPDTPAMRGLSKPTFNILERIASLFIASLSSSAITVHFEPLTSSMSMQTPGDREDVSFFANAEVSNLLEKFKFDYRVRDALFDGAQTGDYCAHFWFDPDAQPYGGTLGAHMGEIRMELVDGINVMFGNPNDRRVETQPWILLTGRDTVEHLRQEAKRVRQNRAFYHSVRTGDMDADADSILADSETQDFPGMGGQTEITGDDTDEGKALYVLLYTKVEKEVEAVGQNGEVEKRRVCSIHVTKATRNAVIYEDVDTGLSNYPLAWGNWKKQKNQYHGRALVTSLIPNQIFINTMFATAMRHLQLLAFPKTIYNADLISTWTNEVGMAIGIRGLQPGQSINSVAANLQPAEMSAQIFALIDKVIQTTKDCLGATDAQLGNIRPDNTSAIIALQANAEVPLENIRAGLHEWVEDIGMILLDMMGTYYGLRPIVVEREFMDPVLGPNKQPMIDPVSGTMILQKVTKKVVVDFDFSVFKNLWLKLRVDVGATTYFSEIAMTQTLDNLRREGMLTAIQYLERVPDKLIPKKDQLLQELRAAVPDGRSRRRTGASRYYGGGVRQNEQRGQTHGAGIGRTASGGLRKGFSTWTKMIRPPTAARKKWNWKTTPLCPMAGRKAICPPRQAKIRWALC